VGNWQCQLEDYNPSLTPNNFTFYTCIKNTLIKFKPIFYQQKRRRRRKSNPSSIILSTNKRREKIKPLFDYKFGSFVAVDYFHSLRLVDTYRALSFYVGKLFPYFSLVGH